jgi:hypothetical protein
MTEARGDLATADRPATSRGCASEASPDRCEARGGAGRHAGPMPITRVARIRRDAAAVAAALLLGALALAACGESAQDKAHAQVCDARKAISEQVTKLQGLTLSSSTVDEAKSGLESIGTELKKM